MTSSERPKPATRPGRITPIPLRVVPEASAARVATAQARIAAEYYDRSEVRDRLVDALLKELQER